MAPNESLHIDPMTFVMNFVESDLTNKSVNTELNYIIAGLSTISFIVLTTILLNYSKGDSKFLGVPISNGILFFSAFVTLLAGLSLNSENFYMIYLLVMNGCIGILLNVYGSLAFFKTPEREGRSLAFKDNSISYIMIGITVPLCLLEMFVVVISAKSDLWHAGAVAMTILQKFLQVGVYHFSIRHKCPATEKQYGASWYLKIMALFNFAMWLQSIADGSTSVIEALKPVLATGASVMSAVYASLVVDYRLLCVLLYIELAIEVEDWDAHENEDVDERSLQSITGSLNNEEAGVANPAEFHIITSQYSGTGYFLGILILLVQFTVALQFLQADERGVVGYWVNVFGILADILVIVQGMALVALARYTEEETSWREASSKGAHIMVALMGVVGVVFWTIRASLTVIMAARMISHGPTFRYLCWISTANIMKILGILFQLFFFFRIAPSTGLRSNIRYQKVAHLMLPFIMLCQLSVFVNTVIDSYSFIVERFVHMADLNIVTAVAYKVGEPLHLGFCLHMFFHFMIVNNNLRRGMMQYQIVAVVEDEPTEDEEDDRQQLLLGEGKYRTV